MLLEYYWCENISFNCFIVLYIWKVLITESTWFQDEFDWFFRPVNHIVYKIRGTDNCPSQGWVIGEHYTDSTLWARCNKWWLIPPTKSTTCHIFSFYAGTYRLLSGQNPAGVIIIKNWCFCDYCYCYHYWYLLVFFYTATVSLGSSDQDEDIEGGMKRKRKKCSHQDKAGERNESFQSLVSIPPVFLVFGSWIMSFCNSW